MDSWPHFLQDGYAQGWVQFNLPWTMEHHAWVSAKAASSTYERQITFTYITRQKFTDSPLFKILVINLHFAYLFVQNEPRLK